MVGYDPSSQTHLSTLEHSVAGSLSGIATRALCQPFDVLKIRFQLQIEPLRTRSAAPGKYHGMLHASSTIIREEGLRAMWKGHLPAQGLSLIYGFVQFASFELLTEKSFLFGFVQHPHFRNFVCGALSGFLATTAALPLDVIRTRLIAQGEPKVYQGTWHAAHCMYKCEGMGSFYRGFIPTVLQIAPYTGFLFFFYKFSFRVWRKLLESSHPTSVTSAAFVGGPVKSFVCGGFAGIVAKVLIYPLDMLKKRIQIIGFEQARMQFGKVHKYHGLIHCTMLVLKDEGYLGLFKGLVPSVIKSALVNACGFLFYEETCKFLRLAHNYEST